MPFNVMEDFMEDIKFLFTLKEFTRLRSRGKLSREREQQVQLVKDMVNLEHNKTSMWLGVKMYLEECWEVRMKK